MDYIRNPFAPGAGTQPPALVGREQILASADIALQRVKLGRPEKSQLLLGLRGVGKTVLLNRISDNAREVGFDVIELEAPEGQRLAEYLAPMLKALLLRLSKIERAKELAARTMGALRGFASVFKVNLGEAEFAVSEPQTADSGNIEVDLPELMLGIGRAASAADKCVALFIDEIQYLNEDDLRGLIVSFHLISQKGLPVILFGAGLPQVAGLAGEAKSYAERLFEFQHVGALSREAAMEAVQKPIEDEGESIEADALSRIIDLTKCYPYFLQEWGKHAWKAAEQSPVRLADVESASLQATIALDRCFFRVRFDRLTPREQDYLRAMADLGPGPHRSGAIAEVLGKRVESLGTLRKGLIKKGMIWSPTHGSTAFTVPLFDVFMLREMPDWHPGA